MADRLIRFIWGICWWRGRRGKRPAGAGVFHSGRPISVQTGRLNLLRAAERLRLLRLALAGDTAAEVDDQEIRRGGASYTIDTVRAIPRSYPGAELYYLIGADQAAQLQLWREAGELARLVEFLVIPRPGEAAGGIGRAVSAGGPCAVFRWGCRPRKSGRVSRRA